MPGTVYKTLFGVQLLHEYYLTDIDETTVFQDMAKKEIFLESMFDKDVPSVSSSILYQIPLALTALLKDYQLRLIPTYAGFSILTQVIEKTLDDGTIVYDPVVRLSADTSLPVLLSLKDNLLKAVTNTRINKNIPAVYFFTNQDLDTKKTFPVLW